ncbi:Uncharacterised protein [Salmonella enterica subsp. enterica]|nr:Uncharacterised protein [Salmonella enterica subsp. enterica]
MQSTAFLCFVIQNQLAIAVEGNLRSGVFIHADFALLIANFVGHVVAKHLFRFVIHRLTALLRGSVSITFLH